MHSNYQHIQQHVELFSKYRADPIAIHSLMVNPGMKSVCNGLGDECGIK